MQISGKLNIEKEYIDFIRHHNNNRCEILEKERHIFRTKSQILDDKNGGFGDKAFRCTSNILVFVNVSYDKKWSHKFSCVDNPSVFEVDLPGITPRDPQLLDIIPKLRIDDKIIFHFLIHTTSDSGVIARRRIGTVAIDITDVTVPTPAKYIIKPLVNSDSISSNITVGHINNLVLSPLKEVLREFSNMRQLSPYIAEKYAVDISAINRREELFWRENQDTTMVYPTDEVGNIRLALWRTPVGMAPLRFFFWDHASEHCISDQDFFANAISIALKRLGDLPEKKFLAYAEIALDYHESKKHKISVIIEARVRATEVVATAIAAAVTASPYLVDMARIPTKSPYGESKLKKIPVEHFGRSADVNSGDCEDKTCTAMILWKRLAKGHWNPRKFTPDVVIKASEIAKQYVHLALLGSVTSPDVLSAKIHQHRGTYVSTDSHKYRVHPYTGHCFSASVPHNYFKLISSITKTNGSIPDCAFWPTLIIEGTGGMRVLPLPYSAYRGAIPLSEEIEIKNSDIQNTKFNNKLHRNIVASHTRGETNAISGILRGFTPLLKDDMINADQYSSFSSDANTSPFYRFIVWAYLPECSDTQTCPNYLLKNNNTGELGISYRMLAEQNPHVRLIKSPEVTKPQLNSVTNKYLKFLPPFPLPSKTPESGSKILKSKGDTTTTNNVLRLYRPGYLEPGRLSIISNIMDLEILQGDLLGYKIVNDNFGEFKIKSGAWDKNLDEAIQCIRLELYLNFYT